MNTGIDNMFMWSTSLETVKIGIRENGITTMQSMFEWCRFGKRIDLENLDMSHVTMQS